MWEFFVGGSNEFRKRFFHIGEFDRYLFSCRDSMCWMPDNMTAMWCVRDCWFQLSQIILYCTGVESYIRQNLGFFALLIRIVCCLAEDRQQLFLTDAKNSAQTQRRSRHFVDNCYSLVSSVSIREHQSWWNATILDKNVETFYQITTFSTPPRNSMLSMLVCCENKVGWIANPMKQHWTGGGGIKIIF